MLRSVRFARQPLRGPSGYLPRAMPHAHSAIAAPFSPFSLGLQRFMASGVVKIGKFQPKAALEVTDAAKKRLQEMIDEHNAQGKSFRLGLKTRGCSGMAYVLEFAEEKDVKKFDEVVDVNGTKVIIDSKALMSVLGTRMDYIEDPLKSEFVFHNPKAKGACGCGESFHV